MYQVLFRTLALRLDPERAHVLAMGLIRSVARVPGLAGAVRATLGRRPARPVPARPGPRR
jgi:dihydroorotate dehydrogenase